MSENTETFSMEMVGGRSSKPTTAYKGKKTVKSSTGDVYLLLDGYYYLEAGLYEVLQRNITSNENTLLLGPTGIGKTEMIAALAKEIGLPITILDMGTMTDPVMSLVGTHRITVEGGVTKSEFTKSRFSDVIQQPGIVFLDELSRANAMSNNLLFPVLDFRRELPMEYCFDDPTPIRVHDECRFFATANIGSEYSGTSKIDKALLNRFMPIQVDVLPDDITQSLLKDANPKLNAYQIKTIMDCYNAINEKHKKYELNFDLSIRQLKRIAGMVNDGFTIYDSFLVSCKGIGGNEGYEAIKALLRTDGKVKKTS